MFSVMEIEDEVKVAIGVDQIGLCLPLTGC